MVPNAQLGSLTNKCLYCGINFGQKKLCFFEALDSVNCNCNQNAYINYIDKEKLWMFHTQGIHIGIPLV